MEYETATRVLIEQAERKKQAPKPAHRVVPRSLELHEQRDEANAWRCAGCGRTFRHPSDADKTACTATSLPLGDV